MNHKVYIEGRAVVTQTSGHTAVAQADICLTPVGPSMVPIPYPNHAAAHNLKDGSRDVRIGDSSVMLQGSQLRPSTGNELGKGGGILSKVTRGPAEAISTSMCVTIEGAHVVRVNDITWNNGKNTIGVIR